GEGRHRRRPGRGLPLRGVAPESDRRRQAGHRVHHFGVRRRGLIPVSGARDTGWTHTRLVGDRDIAQSHVPDARKLLGYARQQASYMGLGTYKVSQELLDGSRITAELHGGIPRITVEAGRSRQPRLVRLKFNGIVVWARSSALPDGIDPEFPQ